MCFFLMFCTTGSASGRRSLRMSSLLEGGLAPYMDSKLNLMATALLVHSLA